MSARVFVPGDAAARCGRRRRGGRGDRAPRPTRARRRRRDRPQRLARPATGSSRWSRSRRRRAASPMARSTADDVAGPVRRRVSRRRRASRCASGRPEEIPFLKRQTRLTFARCGITDPLSLDDYRAHGGCAGLRARARAGAGGDRRGGRRSPGLRGRGGAGFPDRHQMEDGRRDARPTQKYIVCNADEGDSGTFADRMIMEGDPFVLIEGMTIAGLAVGATKGYVYVRSEYPHAIAAMDAAIAIARARRAARRATSLGSAHAFDLEVRVGAGAYVCGEETSLLESLEGKRGMVRAKPPLPAHQGPVRQADRRSTTCSRSPRCRSSSPRAPTLYRDFGMGRSRGTHADPARRQHQARRAGRDGLRRHARRAGRRYRRRHGDRPAGARGAGRRPARRLLPARAVRHAVRLRGLRRAATA